LMIQTPFSRWNAAKQQNKKKTIWFYLIWLEEENRTREFFEFVRQKKCCWNKIKIFNSFFLLHFLNIFIETIFSSHFIGSTNRINRKKERERRRRMFNLGKWLTRWCGLSDLKVNGFIPPPVHMILNSELDGWTSRNPCPSKILRINFVSFLTNLKDNECFSPIFLASGHRPYTTLGENWIIGIRFEP